jgi:hypothetical protein
MNNKNWVEDISDKATYWLVGSVWVVGLTVIGLINTGVL